MANRRLSMRKIKEVLRLTHDGQSKRAPSGAELKHQPQHRQRLSGTGREERGLAGPCPRLSAKRLWSRNCFHRQLLPSRRPKRCRILITSTASLKPTGSSISPSISCGRSIKEQHPDGYQYSQFCGSVSPLSRQARLLHAPRPPGRREAVCRLRRRAIVDRSADP